MERMRRFIPVTDRAGLRQIGCPYSTATLYNHRYLRRFPRLTCRIGRRVMLNVRELERMASRSIKEQEKAAKARAINNG